MTVVIIRFPESSCRPREILKLRIKDVVFKMVGDKQYAEILVNGKTGSLHIPLINSIPYLKDWLDNHPTKSNPNIHLMCSMRKCRPISTNTIFNIYQAYQKEYFPNLLSDPRVTPEDKKNITELLAKPWNPHIRRHSALTDKSRILKEHILRQHAGWTMSSNMHLKYIRYFGNESNESILEAYGLKRKSQEIDKLKPVQCPNCGESSANKPDAKFCVNCRMVLSYDAYTETVEDKQNKESRIEILENQIESLMQSQKEILECLKYPDKIMQISQEK